MRFETEQQGDAVEGYLSDDSAVSEFLDRRTGQYRINDTWHEAMPATRGSAGKRLDLNHGFVMAIVSPGLTRFAGQVLALVSTKILSITTILLPYRFATRLVEPTMRKLGRRNEPKYWETPGTEHVLVH